MTQPVPPRPPEQIAQGDGDLAGSILWKLAIDEGHSYIGVEDGHAVLDGWADRLTGQEADFLRRLRHDAELYHEARHRERRSTEVKR